MSADSCSCLFTQSLSSAVRSMAESRGFCLLVYVCEGLMLARSYREWVTWSSAVE